MADAIIYYCTTDDSWGVCHRDALLIVECDKMNDDEVDAYQKADGDGEVLRVLRRVQERVSKQAVA